jgi:acyl dehydratase
VTVTLVEQLSARIGETVGVGEWVTVSQEQIDRFAESTGDHQWIHVDPERAARGPFGTTIAHGFLTLSLIPAIAPTVDVGEVRMAINYGLDRVRFISPVPVGSRLRAHVVLKEVVEVAGGVHVKNEITLELEGAEKPACVAEALVRYYP